MRAVLRMMTLWVATVALGCVRVSAFWAYELGAHSSPQRDAYLHQRSAQRMAAVHARLHGHVPNRTEWLAAQQKVRAAAHTPKPQPVRCARQEPGFCVSRRLPSLRLIKLVAKLAMRRMMGCEVVLGWSLGTWSVERC